MKQKILFFDIDGTLIDEETDVVPESAKKALAAAKEKGHLLFICSGRCLAIIPQNVVELGFDGLIGGCGTYIEMEGKEVYHHTLPMELQKEIIKDLEKYHIDGVLEGKDCSAFRRDYWMPKVVSIFTENGSFTARTQCYWDEEFSFDKMALWFDESSDFGDSANDVSMLACVNTSVAMGSGNPILFDKVTLVTDGVMEDGIAHAIEKLGLLD